MSLDDKVALVTGAAQGMGRAIAMRLAIEGANVVATDINGQLVEQTSIDIRELGYEAIAVEADIGDIDDIDRVVDEALNAFGRIDILVNNAGITRHADIMDLTAEDLSKFRINVRVSDQQECHLLGVAMVSDYVASTFFREGVIGGLSAFRYFFTVFLWTPVSRVIPLIDRPLRFAA